MTDPGLRPFQREEWAWDIIMMLLIHEAILPFRPTRQTAHGDQQLVRNQYVPVHLIQRHVYTSPTLDYYIQYHVRK